MLNHTNATKNRGWNQVLPYSEYLLLPLVGMHWSSIALTSMNSQLPLVNNINLSITLCSHSLKIFYTSHLTTHFCLYAKNRLQKIEYRKQCKNVDVQFTTSNSKSGLWTWTSAYNIGSMTNIISCIGCCNSLNS